MKKTITRAKKFSGSPKIPGDKSISHRSLLFGAMSSGTTTVSHLLNSADVNSTASCLQALGVKIEKVDQKTIVYGKGAENFISPKTILDCGNSGTTMRLLMGILSACPQLEVSLTGDFSLVKRPMKRVAEPLNLMGANIKLTNDNFAPMTIKGTQLKGVNYHLKIASAQIKTAVMLAGIFAKGETVITGEIHSRDHTERMLAHFGVQVQSNDQEIRIPGGQKFKANDITVPGDPSTAAFWLAAAALIPNSEINLKNISLNKTRIGFIEILKRMGASVETKITHTDPEPVGTITARYGKLKAVTISEAEIPSLIDELPIFAVLASQATGKTVVTGAEELRVKETDRIEAVAVNLRNMGVKIETTPDGFIIEGPQKLNGTRINSFHDHRIAMSFSIAGLIANGTTTICDAECVDISYPNFFATLEELVKNH